MKHCFLTLAGVLVASFAIFAVESAESRKPFAERGKEALLGKSFGPAFVSMRGYENLWRQWGVAERPADYAQAVSRRYGLSPAPYPNSGLPMGLRQSWHLTGKGVGFDCMLCHASSVFGRAVIGLGNSSLDWQAMADDFAAADKLPHALPFALCNVRGTTEASAVIAHFMQYRDVELRLRPKVKLQFRTDLCEDTPAWWLLRKKKTVYHPGTHPAQSVRLLMSLGLHPLNSAEFIKSCEPAFADIRAYLLTLEAPKYPFPIDAGKAGHGKRLFAAHLPRSATAPTARTGPTPTRSSRSTRWGPTRPCPRGSPSTPAVPTTTAGLARRRARPAKRRVATDAGYQAPPLDGVWATAPYFHNGSVPTLYHVLNSGRGPGSIHAAFAPTGRL